MEKVQQMYHVGMRETNTSESSLTCREPKTASKLGGFIGPRSIYQKPVYWVDGARHRDGVTLIQALMLNSRNLSFRCKGRKLIKRRVPMRSTGAEQPVVARQRCNGCWAKRLPYSVVRVDQLGIG